MSSELVAALAGAIIGAVIGAGLTWLFSIRLRNSEKWKLFQEEIGTIKARLVEIERESDIVVVEVVYRKTLKALASAVYRVRPYIRNASRTSLIKLLNDYRNAPRSKESGFIALDPAGNYKGRPADLFCNPTKAISTLIDILNRMDNL